MAKYLDHNIDKNERVDNFTGSSYLHDTKTGISKFHLSTINNSGKPVVLTGLLNELPEISFTVNYNDGPGKSWQDTINNFFGGETAQLINALGSGGSNSRNLVTGSTWTKKIYNGYSTSTIPLKFRIYSSDTLGQTPAQDWINNLAVFATLATDNTMSPELLLLNGLATIDSAKAEAIKLSEILGNNAANTDNGSTNKEKTQADNQNANVDNVLKIDKLIAESANSFSLINVKLKKALKDNNIINFVSNWANAAKGYTREYYIVVEMTVKNAKTNSNITKTFSASIGRNASSFTNSHQNVTDIISVDKFFEGLDDIGDQIRDAFGEEAKSRYMKCVNQLKSKADLENNNETNDDFKDLEKIYKAGKFLANNIGDHLISKFDKYRVVSEFNKNNMLGEKLWYLSIYEDIIFKKTSPLIVIISDWSAKPSIEYDTSLDMPVYYDFEITCMLDQTYSNEQWNNILVDDLALFK